MHYFSSADRPKLPENIDDFTLVFGHFS